MLGTIEKQAIRNLNILKNEIKILLDYENRVIYLSCSMLSICKCNGANEN